MDQHSHDHDHGNGGGGNVGRWVFWGFILIAGFFLFTEHRAHLYGILPYLLLLACPLMHLFHGHGDHGHHHHEEPRDGQGPGSNRDASLRDRDPPHQEH